MLTYAPTTSNIDNEMAAWIADNNGVDYRSVVGSHSSAPNITLSIARGDDYAAGHSVSATETLSADNNLFNEQSAFQGTNGPSTRLSLINTNNDRNRDSDATPPARADYRNTMNAPPADAAAAAYEGTESNISSDASSGLGGMITYSHAPGSGDDHTR